MVCCVILGCIVGTILKCWRVITFRKTPEPILFAPVARRPAPGTPEWNAWQSRPDEPGETFDDEPVVTPSVFTLGWLRGLLAGMLAYVAAVGVMHALHLLPSALDGTLWWWRSAAFAALALGVPAVATRLSRPSHTPASRSSVLISAGLTWIALGLADLHLFAVFTFADHTHDASAWSHWLDTNHLAFHGVGIALAAAGLLSRQRQSLQHTTSSCLQPAKDLP